MRGNIILDCIRLAYGAMRIGMNLIAARFYIARASDPVIALFGGMEVDQRHQYAQKARVVARALAQARFSVLTGGGPGIMEAANCGASEVSAQQSFAFGVKGADVGYNNPCAKVFRAYNYFVRKWMLIHYAQGFVILPGGFGTGDEFFELLNLMKMRARTQIPVILVGTEYWQPLIIWLTTQALKEGFVSEQDLNLFFATDSVEEVIHILKQ